MNDTPGLRRIVRWLIAAEGYLELQMPEAALRNIDEASDHGPLRPVADYLRGQALRQQERYEEAIVPLQRAARTLPMPFKQRAWLALSDCFRHRGNNSLADTIEKVVAQWA
ncbi:MAG: tetratricopeptide repeat protein [Planctomycetes bacterium]|nr:tetratricopeptide repeat protein [Planctomycetota bacterium]